MVKKLVPKKLTRSTTDDTQTAINRVVHEAVARSETRTPELAEEVGRLPKKNLLFCGDQIVLQEPSESPVRVR